MPKKKPAKPRSRRAATAPGVNTEEQRRARLEARRQAKAEALAARARRDRRRRLVRNALTLALLAVAVWFLFLRQTAPTEIAGHEVASFGSSGVNDHREGAIEYDTVPPVAGPHSNNPSPCGIYGDVAPNEDPGAVLSHERLVHALEHGTVAVYYSPELPPGQVKAIEDIAREFDSHVLTAPYEGMDPLISVASWGRRMDLDALDEDAVRGYIEEFRQKGPEEVPCPMDADDPYLPELPESDATETPAPDDEAEEGDGGNGGEGEDGGKNDGGKKDGGKKKKDGGGNN